MARYLLACECGKQNPVELGQAGGQITCSCGKLLDVPPLRKLRHLPIEEAADTRVGARWGRRQGWIAGFLILAAALVIANIWSWATQPKLAQFDPAAHQRAVDEYLKQLTPSDAWQRWTEYYRPMADRGFPIFEPANAAGIEREIAHRQFLRRTLWIAAATLAAIAAAIASWPRPQPRV